MWSDTTQPTTDNNNYKQKLMENILFILAVAGFYVPALITVLLDSFNAIRAKCARV